MTIREYHKQNGWKLRATNKQFREYLSGLAAVGIRRGESIAAAVRKRNARRDTGPVDPLSYTIPQRVLAHRKPITCGDKYQRLAEEMFPRRRNWKHWREVAEVLPDGWDVTENNNGRYSSRCPYTHWTYTVRVTSYGLVLSPQRLRVRLGTDSRIIQAPRGYHWDTDGLGVKLVANANATADYHPSAEDLEGPMRELTRTLRANHRTRQANAKAARRQANSIRQAEREGLAVCVADSCRAGNCATGTRQWATQRGLDPARHYTPKQLLALANGDARQVSLVIFQAMRRHTTEQTQGFCCVADHR